MIRLIPCRPFYRQQLGWPAIVAVIPGVGMRPRTSGEYLRYARKINGVGRPPREKRFESFLARQRAWVRERTRKARAVLARAGD